MAGWRTTFGSPLFADHVPDPDELIVERVRARGRRHRRQDQRAGVRGRLAHVQPRLRHHAQPGRPDPVGGRLQRGSGLRARRRHGAAGRRLRHGRLAAQPGVVLRRRRPAPEPGPGARVAAVQPVGDHLGRRPDGAHRRRPRAAALGDGRARPARARRRSASPGAAFAPPRRGGSLAGLRVALSTDLGGAFEVDHEVAAVVECSAAVFAGAGAAVAAAHPDLAERRRDLPHPARLALAGQASARCSPSTPTRSSSRSPTTSGSARASAAPTSPRPTPSRTALSERMRPFFASYDVLVLPVSQVPPFPADQEYPARRSTGGRWRPTWTGCARRTSSPSPAVPAISVPAAPPPTGCRSGSRSSRRTAPSAGLLEVAAALRAGRRSFAPEAARKGGTAPMARFRGRGRG